MEAVPRAVGSCIGGETPMTLPPDDTVQLAGSRHAKSFAVVKVYEARAALPAGTLTVNDAVADGENHLVATAPSTAAEAPCCGYSGTALLVAPAMVIVAPVAAYSVTSAPRAAQRASVSSSWPRAGPSAAACCNPAH